MTLIRNILASILMMFAFTIAPVDSDAQNYLLLLKKKGSPKNYKYTLGSDISVRSKVRESKITGQIHQISDSTLTIDFTRLVYLEDIDNVYRERYWFRLSSTLLFVAGAGYFILDVFNRSINNMSPIVTENTMITTASIIGVGVVFKLFDTRRCRIGKKWELQLLDLSY